MMNRISKQTLLQFSAWDGDITRRVSCTSLDTILPMIETILFERAA